MPTLVAIHGIATTARVWDELAARLPELDVLAPERPRTGELVAEVAALAPQADGRWVLGMSGGATLGLALASAVPFAGAVLHEPAVGSLVPGLLNPVRAAFASGGTAALGAALYGPLWQPAMAGHLDDDATARELEMFAAFEPAAPIPGQGPVVVTYGARSPAVRREAAEALADRFGYRVLPVPGVGHFAAVEDPAGFARLVTSVVRGE